MWTLRIGVGKPCNCAGLLVDLVAKPPSNSLN